MITQLMTQLSHEMKLKVSTEKGDDYKTGCLLELFLKKKKKRLIAANLSKKGLDVDSRIIQQIIFTGKIKATVAITRVIIYYILDQSKKTFF